MRQAHPVRAAHPVRQAHPIRQAQTPSRARRPRSARRPLRVVWLTLAVGASSFLALSATASGPSARPVTNSGAVAVRGAVTAAPQVPPASPSAQPDARDLPFDGPPVALRAPQPASLDGVAIGQTQGRPDIVLPDVEPIVVPRAPRGARVVVLGDSFTTGLNGAGLGSRNWTSIVARSRGWTVTNLAVAGTGFMNPGWTNQPVGSLVARTVRLRPDVVILAAGHNDSRWSATSTGREADRVIARLRVGLPDAVIVIVAPIWQNGSPPARCLLLRDHLRRMATTIGAPFVDPLAERWFAGANHRFIGSDGLHPTNAGHVHIADMLLGDLALTLAT